MELREYFASLPEEYEREYELKLTEKVNMKEVTEKKLQRMVDKFKRKQKTLSGEKLVLEEKIAYAAVYCLNILYRHTFDNAKFSKIAQENRNWCKNHETFSYIEILQRCNDAEALRGRENADMKTLFQYTQTYPENAGYAHAVANLYASVCEGNYNRREYFRRRWQKKAEDAVLRAISLDSNYAVYYCTQGRIALLAGQYDEAEALFEQAIHKENPAARDGYSIRISRYLTYKSQAQMLRVSAEAQQQVEALKAASVSNIEILSFFSSVVAFIIGSLTLAKDQKAAEAAVLIAVLMGALLVVFSVFTFLLRLNTRQETKIHMANLLVGFLGIIIVIGGIWYVSPH